MAASTTTPIPTMSPLRLFLSNSLPHALFLLAVLPLISCTGIQPNYLTPESSTTASVEFNDPNQFNRRVIIHGSDICKLSEARLVGLVNSKTIGVPSLSGKPVTVPADRLLVVSSPWVNTGMSGIGGPIMTIKTQYCQPIAIFSPIAGHKYEVALDACIIRVKDKETAETVRISSFDKCKLVPPRLSPMPEWMFLFRQEG